MKEPKWKKIAKAFDKQRDEPKLTPEQKEIIEQRKANQKLTNERTKNSHLEKFQKFNDDALTYLHFLVSQGDFTGKGEKTQLFTLMTLVKIEQGLKELVTVLKSRK